MLELKEISVDPLLDQLTGLYNRQGLFEVGRGVLARCCWKNSPVTILYIDIDDFAGFNREYGTFAGDQLLLRVANGIRSKCRGSDISARLDSDKFVILLPDTPPERGLLALHRVRELLESLLENRESSATAAIGAVTYLVCPSSVAGTIETLERIVQDLKTNGVSQTAHQVLKRNEEQQK